MGKFLVLLCFALLSVTLVMACQPWGLRCTSDDDCCPPYGCLQVNPWVPNSICKCVRFNWGQRQWGQQGQWEQDPWNCTGVDLPVKEPTEQSNK